MRIIAGEWRGRPIVAPTGATTRPTSDRAREGLFSMLASRLGGFDGLNVADLFAGSGALGLEALSRGAARCTFIEKDGGAIAAIRRNLASFDADGRADIRQTGVEHAPPPARLFDLVFLDPPYSADFIPAVERAAGWTAPGGWLSIETSAAFGPPPSLTVVAERRFGKALITLLQK